MPPINEYKCNKCGYSFPRGWGGYMYVIDGSGKRIICPHPAEMHTVSKVLGENASRELIMDKTGFNSDCVCLNCLHQFELDIGDYEIAESWRYFYGAIRRRDERRCLYCNSVEVRTVFELIDEPCPKCKEGKIEEIITGIIS